MGAAKQLDFISSHLVQTLFLLSLDQYANCGYIKRLMQNQELFFELQDKYSSVRFRKPADFLSFPVC